jgi:ABC-type Na+ efflux pump permease subunit
MKSEIKQWIMFKAAAVFIMSISVGSIYVICFYIEMVNVKSLIIQGDIIEFSGKVIICMGGIPMFIWMLFFAFRILINKGSGTIKTKTLIGSVWGGVSIFSFVAGFISALIIPFILIASSYTSCNIGKYSSYYVINPELCKTIVPDQWVIK